jgi:hypothetical protein
LNEEGGRKKQKSNNDDYLLFPLGVVDKKEHEPINKNQEYAPLKKEREENDQATPQKKKICR